jgi:hypothetical protein
MAASTLTATGNANLGMPVGLEGLGAQEVVTGLQVQHYDSPGPSILSEIKLTNVAFSWASGTAGSQNTALKLYTFPRGKIHFHNVSSFIIETTTSAIAGTLIGTPVSVVYGLGSVTAGGDTLATTEQNILPGTGVTSVTLSPSTVINVPLAGVSNTLTAAAPTMIDGSTTAVPLFLNFAVPVDADLLAAATMTITARFLVNWTNLGGFQYWT